MATLYLMVGLPCSGKTTRAKELENELFALRLTPDEWHVNLFGHDINDPEHDKRYNLIESMLWQIAARALILGTNIILDFGFWAKEEREDFRSRAKKIGARSEIVFMDIDEKELIKRVKIRSKLASLGARAVALNHRRLRGTCRPPAPPASGLPAVGGGFGMKMKILQIQFITFQKK